MSEKKGRSKKKKFLIALGCIFSVFALVIGAAVIYIGPDNVKALYYGIKYDKEEINVMIEESSKRLDEKVAEYDYIIAREPTQIEMQAVADGVITSEQLSEIISGGITLNEYLEKRSENPEPEASEEDGGEDAPVVNEESADEPVESPVTTQQVAEPEVPVAETQPVQATPEEIEAARQAECDAKVSQIVAKMYILRSSFTGSLSGLASQAYADYQAGVSKADIISTYIGQGQSLEAQCDGNVDALMSELTGILTEYGRTTELVDTIYATYESEKQYTKAYYMSLYLNN